MTINMQSLCHGMIDHKRHAALINLSSFFLAYNRYSTVAAMVALTEKDCESKDLQRSINIVFGKKKNVNNMVHQQKKILHYLPSI